MIQISVVVPVFNEEESLPELTQWIHRVMQEHQFSYEVLLINDGSTDRSWEVIQSLASKSEALKGINFTRNYGKSAALDAGFKRCSGEVVITMDDSQLLNDREIIRQSIIVITRQAMRICKIS